MTAAQHNAVLAVDPSLPATESMKTEAATSPVAPTKAGAVIKQSSSTCSTDGSKSMKRGVSFDKIEIREYSRCLGLNPATTYGPSLSIDWGYNEAGTYDLEEYESSRPQRRATQQMLVPGSVREEILLNHTDVTRKQISQAIAENKVARSKRQMCIAMQEFEDWAKLGETLMRRWRRMRSGISKKKEQQLLWENAKRALESKAAKKALTESGSDDGSTEATTELTDCEARPSVSTGFTEIRASNQ